MAFSLQSKVADDSLVARPTGAYRNTGISNTIITDISGADSLATHKTQSNRLPTNQINASTTMLYNHVLPYYHPSNYSSLSCYPVSDFIHIFVNNYTVPLLTADVSSNWSNDARNFYQNCRRCLQ